MGLPKATLLILALIAGLFALATLVERSGRRLESRTRLRHLTYTLALGGLLQQLDLLWRRWQRGA
jgi:hypothetical protein